MLSRGQLHAVQTTVCFWAMFAAAASGAAAADLPIEVQQVDLPESLHRVHLYSQRDEPLPDGDRIEFVGRYAKQQGTLIFCDPPWIHVSWREEGKDAAEMQQAFSARPDRLPEQAADGAMFRASGAITRNRPDLTYHERERLRLHHFNLRDAELVPLETAVDDDAARAIFAREIARARMRLEGQCRQLGLTYVGPQDAKPSVSWYQGNLAVTDVVTPKPVYSRSSVPYATASVVIEPESGKPLRVVLQRRLHRDPPD